ncbi:NAD(P)/FAD-dependent oxidoreductase [Natrialbaceae archaeon A-gly3]
MGRGPVPRRRGGIGFLAGVVPGIVLASTLEPWILGIVLGPVFGLAYGLGVRTDAGSSLDHGLGGAALSVPAWVLVSVLGLALVQDGSPAWAVDDLAPLLTELPVWLLAGFLLGLLVPTVSRALEVGFGPATREESLPDVESRIVVVGGGFAGMAVARRLETRFGPDPTVELVLVSETNSLLFTPMLAEVAAGSLEPTHVTTPLRSCLRRTQVLNAAVTDVDVDARTVTLRGDEGASDTLGYDHLVLTPGSVADYKGLEGVREFAFGFKTLQDAMAIRNHVVSRFERADREADPETRKSLLTFVVAGAGFAGAELAGALNDFARGIVAYYPNVSPEEVSVVVVHSRERIMPELGDELAAYALERMRERGVEFRLEAYVVDADGDAGTVSLSTGETIGAETLVWTAGNRPDPLIETMDIPLESGAIGVDRFLSVPGREGLWAAGDCAAIPDPTGGRYPNTAEHAIRAGTVLADNVYASVTGGERTPLEYDSFGSLVVVGYQTACAEIRDRRFSGLFAWLLWRGVYLVKLPGLDRKIRVFVAWLIELLFPRDIVQTMGEPRTEGKR